MEKQRELKRSLSPLNVWALAFGCIIGWGAFVMPGNTFLLKAGPLGTAIAMGCAVIIMFLIAVNYSYMINRFPVAGGEFTFSSKSFGRVHGFICAWFLCISYLSIVPLNATALALLSRSLLSSVFQFGFHYTVAGYDIYLGELLLAVASLAIFAWLNIRGAKMAGAFQTLLAMLLVLGVAVVAIAALLSPAASADHLRPGFVPDRSPLVCVLSVLAVVPWAFVGFDTVPQAIEESDFSPVKTRLILFVSILFGAAVYVVNNTVTAAVVPDGYTNWYAYISDLDRLSGLPSLPTFHAAYQLLGSAGLTFLGLAVLAAILSGIIGFYMATSRLLYSMAKEKVLPRWFAALHPVYRTPANAILFVLVVSLVAPFFGRTALNWVVDMSSTGAAVGYGYTSAAALKLALAEKRPSMVACGLLGLLFSIVFCVLLLVPLPMFDCSLSRESYICLIIWVFLGSVFYLTAGRSGSKV
ncbi:MAG: APC family permease [Oscillospiraceae bacterium]|nr:APC family permease [Oscillospiraceae bacterium]